MLSRIILATVVSTLTALPTLAQEVDRRTVLDGAVVLEDAPEVPAVLRERLNRYQNVRSAGLIDWTADGSGIYVGTRFGDVSQIHRVDMPGGVRRQLTFYDEPANGHSRRPGGSEVLYLMDVGGSEFYQYFLLDPRTGESRRLTDGESRNSSATWSPDGEILAYTSTRRTGRANDVWVMAVSDSASARVVVEASDGSLWGAADWDETGDRLLVQQYVSITDSRVHLLDVGTGEIRRIVGGDEAPASWLGITPVFTPDGRGAFLATDSQSDFQQLVRFDLDGGGIEVITEDIPWNVDEFEINEQGTRAAFVTNERGIDRLYLMDPATLEYAPVEGVPTGLIGGLRFDPQGSRIAMTLNTAQTPSDVFVLELGDSPLEAGKLTRWTYSEVGGLDTETFAVPEVVEFPTFDEVNGEPRMIPAFVFRPAGEGPHPVIVYIHGGPESQYRPGFSSTFQMWIQTLGVAVVAPNVRGSAGYGKTYVKLDNGRSREDSVKDIGALLDWIATRPDLDENRVAVYGGSYGGYMVLASLVEYSDRLRAGVDIVGISNFVTFLENTQDYRRDLRRPEYGDERDPEMREFLESISPNNHADRITAPLFVAQGANDPRVPLSESEQIVEAVRGNGYHVWYMNALNEGHGYRKKPNRDLLRELVVMFFETHLIGETEVAAATSPTVSFDSRSGRRPGIE